MTKKFSKKVGILGYGEVGQAIAKFHKDPRLRKRFGGQAKIKDLNRDDGLDGVEILHICIPWSENFIEIVKKEIKKIKPKLTIIHSTVAPGVTKKIIAGLPKELKIVVHSPVRGMHPNLYGGIKTFVKYIGADNKKAGLLAQKHLESLGIKTKVFYPSVTTEALKLWDTTQYGWMIVLNKEIKKWCDKRGLDFNAIYTEANKSYNEGYRKLGRPEVIRPFLKYMPGKIGGHCIIPNCRLLDSEFAKFIFKKNNSYKCGK
jgi:UDP-N-acetyl-D-mannosaminuronate dehydrogenase